MKFLELPLGTVFTVTDQFYSPVYVKISNVYYADNPNITYLNSCNYITAEGSLFGYAVECTVRSHIDINSDKYKNIIKLCSAQGCINTTYAALLTQIQELRGKRNGTLHGTTNICGNTELKFEYLSANSHTEWVTINYHESKNNFITYQFTYFEKGSISSNYAYTIWLNFNGTGDLISYVCRDVQNNDTIRKCNILEISDYFTTQEVYKIICLIVKEVINMEKETKQQFTTDTMDDKALNIVLNYAINHLDKSDDLPEIIPYIVWKSKILKNWKYLISTTLYDGMYYELTYNGETKEWYLDAYKKFENKVIKE
jgi:hypothetical protein